MHPSSGKALFCLITMHVSAREYKCITTQGFSLKSSLNNSLCRQLFRSKTCIMDILRECNAGNRVLAMVNMLYNVANDVNSCNEVTEIIHLNQHK